MLVLCACNNSDGQETPRQTTAAPSGAPAASAESFCLSLISARKDVLLGEPLTLLVELRNCGKSSQRIRDLLSVEFGLLAVWMRAPRSDKEEIYQSPVKRDGRGARYVELGAGETISAFVPVYLDSQGWNLADAGYYRFRAEFPVTGVIVRSKEIEVSVRPPPDEVSAAAARAMMHPSAARHLLLEGGDPKGREQLRYIAEKYAGSPWASYARLSLAADAAATSSSEKSAACRDLEAAAGRVPDWISALRGHEVLIRCLLATGERERAQRISRDIVRSVPQARGLRGMRVE